MPGTPGQFFKEFGLTVAVAVLFSLVVARLLTPLLAAYFLKPAKNPHPRKDFKGFYRNVLDWSLDHRILACIIGGLIFVGSIMAGSIAFQPEPPKQKAPEFPPGPSHCQPKLDRSRITRRSWRRRRRRRCGRLHGWRSAGLRPSRSARSA